jgi:hypothetical protein
MLYYLNIDIYPQPGEDSIKGNVEKDDFDLKQGLSILMEDCADEAFSFIILTSVVEQNDVILKYLETMAQSPNLESVQNFLNLSIEFYSYPIEKKAEIVLQNLNILQGALEY